MQSELLQDEEDEKILDQNLLEEFLVQVHESINEVCVSHKSMKNVQEQLERIENVKDEISSWYIDVMNADDTSQEDDLKVGLHYRTKQSLLFI